VTFTLRERAANGNRPAKVTVEVPIDTLIRVEGIARQRGITRKQALEDAIGWWMVKNEEQLNRKHRLAVDKAMREAGDAVPVHVVLDRLQQGLPPLTRAEYKDSLEGLQSAGGCRKVADMSGTETQPQTEQISFHVPIELAAELRRLAQARERTLAAEMRLALKAHLATESVA
jgi:predicted transcriptional regulator